jgi:hypothetical protein
MSHDMYRESYLSMYIVNREYNLKNLSRRMVRCMSSNFKLSSACNQDGKGLLRGTAESLKNGTAGFKFVSRRSRLLLQPTQFKLINLKPLLSTPKNCYLTIHVSCIKEIRVLRLLFEATSLHLKPIVFN